MEISQIIPHIEALIFASEKPLTSIELVDLVNNALGFIEDRATLEQIESAIDGIREKYSTEFYPFEVRQSGGGWQFLTKGSFHKTIAQLNGDKFLKRLSAAAMETLAIIAYKQPITKGEVESIRGVNCDYVIQKLLEKELIVISGRNEDLPGKPLIYNTSKSFMDYFGINSADDLPKIKEILAEQVVTPTLVKAEQFEVEEGSKLQVGEDGSLFENIDSAVSDAEEETAPAVESAEEEMVDPASTAEADADVTEALTDEAVTEEENLFEDEEAPELSGEEKLSQAPPTEDEEAADDGGPTAEPDEETPRE